jgi:hypothetical protein
MFLRQKKGLVLKKKYIDVSACKLTLGIGLIFLWLNTYLMFSLLIKGELLCFNYHQGEINVIIGNLMHLNMCPLGHMLAFAIKKSQILVTSN